MLYGSKKSKGLPRQAEGAQGAPGRLRPRIFLTFRHYKGGSPSTKRNGRLYPRRNPWYSLSEAESTSGHTVLSVVPREKVPSDTTGNRSRDRSTISAAPYPLRYPRPQLILYYSRQIQMNDGQRVSSSSYHIFVTEHKSQEVPLLHQTIQLQEIFELQHSCLINYFNKILLRQCERKSD